MTAAIAVPADAGCSNCTWSAGNHLPEALPTRLGLTCGDYSPPLPEPVLPAGPDWDALEAEAMGQGRNGDGDRVYVCRKGFKTSVSDDVSEPDSFGHMVWSGEFKVTNRGRDDFPRPSRGGIHKLCGRSHHFVARAFKEEALGRALPDDVDVVNTCGLAACVSPDHFELRRHR